jgi:type IX secretion system PorP/SprF family membrane protein
MQVLRTILILLVGFAGMTARAQDPHFSMYQLAPMAVNPAFTGLIPNGGNQRLTINHRAQWAQPGSMRGFQTTAFSYSTSFCDIPQVGRFALGLQLMDDRAGFSPLRRSSGNLTGSYTRKLFGEGKRFRSGWGDGGSFLSVGFEAGGIQHSLDPSRLRFDEQFDGRDYDPSIPGESFDRTAFLMGDMGVGLLFYRASRDWADGGFTLGGSVRHVNQPAYQFFDNIQNPEGLPALWNIHSSVSFGKNRIAGLVRAMFMQQGTYQQILGGVELLSRFGKVRANNPNFSGGISYRHVRFLDSGFRSDALVLSLQTQLGKGVLLAASYDLSLSKVRDVSNNGAFELALHWVFNDGRNCPIVCPYF